MSNPLNPQYPVLSLRNLLALVGAAGAGLVVNVADIDALEGLLVRPPLAIVDGLADAGDGLGGAYYWAPGDVTPPDGETVIECLAGPAGRYRLVGLNLVNSNAPTLPPFTNSTLVASTAYVDAAIARLTVPSVAALAALTTRPTTVMTLGFGTANDGGGGPPWQWVAGSVLAADGFLVVSPAGGPPGRYVRFLQQGASVSPKWNGCSLGAADDSAAFQQVLDNYLGAAIDISACTLPVKNRSVLPGSLLPGIFSDGSGVLTAPAGSVAADNGITVTKLDGFFFRNIRVVLPVSTNPVVAPAMNRMIWFSTTADSQEGVDWEVSDCHITGGLSAIVCGGRAKNFKAFRNYITGTWGDGISGPSVPNGAYICDNTLEDGGYATGASQPSGAIRIGSSTSEHSGNQISICRNLISNYCVNASQSAIDCFSNSLSQTDVSDNVIRLCGGGIELKTAAAPVLANEFYQRISVNNNTFTLLNVASVSCITIFYASPGAVPGKGANIKVQGNHGSCLERPTSGNGVYGVSLLGFNDCSIVANTFFNVTHGIAIAGTGTSNNTAYRPYISGNTIDAVTYAIQGAGGTVNGMCIHDNPLLKSQFSPAVSLSAGTFNDTSIERNFIWSTNNAGLEFRDTHGAIVRDNTIWGISAVFLQGTASSDSTFEENRFYTQERNLPAVSGTVTNPGTGLTDGLRYFTVTNGTGSTPTVFRCTVAGGTITSGVTIVQPGMYSVFPGVPVVTVDSGIVGGATFTLTAAVPGPAMNAGAGATNIVVQKNSVDVPAAQRTYIGAGAAGVLPADNTRGTITADPAATFAGALGDVFLNGALALGGPKEWLITTAGNVGAAVWSPSSQVGGLQRVAPVALGANVLLNNVANYFNGPTTGALGAAGQVWLVFGNFVVSQSSAGPDYYSLQLWNGAAIVGDEQVVTSVGVGTNVAGSLFAIVTLAAATTFTLRAKDASSVDGSLLADGTSIGAVRLA